MTRTQTVSLEPRKSPVQARSIASVQAILAATIQVLLEVGKEDLTTTKVSERAGVSVGSLYQYFPNKSALLQASLRNHLEEVASAVERVCKEEQGSSLTRMVTRLVNAFLEAKMRDLQASVALYSVSSDVDGWRIAQEVSQQLHHSVGQMLSTASEPLQKDTQLITSMILAAMAGVSRRLLESPSPRQQYEPLRQELLLMLRAYLDMCTMQPE